jgi:polyhydroxyalkanoate synthesis regulator phasin
MSVKRYKVEELNCCFDADMVESPAGEYVEYSDYASLKAEVERLEKQVNNLIASLQKSHDEHGKALYKLKYKK